MGFKEYLQEGHENSTRSNINIGSLSVENAIDQVDPMYDGLEVLQGITLGMSEYVDGLIETLDPEENKQAIKKLQIYLKSVDALGKQTEKLIKSDNW